MPRPKKTETELTTEGVKLSDARDLELAEERIKELEAQVKELKEQLEEHQCKSAALPKETLEKLHRTVSDSVRRSNDVGYRREGKQLLQDLDALLLQCD